MNKSKKENRGSMTFALITKVIAKTHPKAIIITDPKKEKSSP